MFHVLLKRMYVLLLGGTLYKYQVQFFKGFGKLWYLLVDFSIVHLYLWQWAAEILILIMFLSSSISFMMSGVLLFGTHVFIIIISSCEIVPSQKCSHLLGLFCSHYERGKVITHVYRSQGGHSSRELNSTLTRSVFSLYRAVPMSFLTWA